MKILLLFLQNKGKLIFICFETCIHLTIENFVIGSVNFFENNDPKSLMCFLSSVKFLIKKFTIWYQDKQEIYYTRPNSKECNSTNFVSNNTERISYNQFSTKFVSNNTERISYNQFSTNFVSNNTERIALGEVDFPFHELQKKLVEFVTNYSDSIILSFIFFVGFYILFFLFFNFLVISK